MTDLVGAFDLGNLQLHNRSSDCWSRPLEALYLTGPADDGVQKTLKDFGRGQELELDRDTKAGIAQWT